MGRGWARKVVIGVGGLTEVGLIPDSELLLVVSHQGRGVVDARTGAVIGRDRSEKSSTWFDARGPSALAIAPAEGWIQVAGLAGGELPSTDGACSLSVSDAGVVVRESDGSEALLPESEEIRVTGFTPAGKVIVATPSSLAIYERLT
jgi:hypothetical protein